MVGVSTCQSLKGVPVRQPTVKLASLKTPFNYLYVGNFHMALSIEQIVAVSYPAVLAEMRKAA